MTLSSDFVTTSLKGMSMDPSSARNSSQALRGILPEGSTVKPVPLAGTTPPLVVVAGGSTLPVQPTPIQNRAASLAPGTSQTLSKGETPRAPGSSAAGRVESKSVVLPSTSIMRSPGAGTPAPTEAKQEKTWRQSEDPTLKPFLREGQEYIGQEAMKKVIQGTALKGNEAAQIRVPPKPCNGVITEGRTSGLHEIVPTDQGKILSKIQDQARRKVLAEIQSGARSSTALTLFQQVNETYAIGSNDLQRSQNLGKNCKQEIVQLIRDSKVDNPLLRGQLQVATDSYEKQIKTLDDHYKARKEGLEESYQKQKTLIENYCNQQTALLEQEYENSEGLITEHYNNSLRDIESSRQEAVAALIAERNRNPRNRVKGQLPKSEKDSVRRPFDKQKSEAEKNKKEGLERIKKDLDERLQQAQEARDEELSQLEERHDQNLDHVDSWYEEQLAGLDKAYLAKLDGIDQNLAKKIGDLKKLERNQRLQIVAHTGVFPNAAHTKGQDAAHKKLRDEVKAVMDSGPSLSEDAILVRMVGGQLRIMPHGQQIAEDPGITGEVSILSDVRKLSEPLQKAPPEDGKSSEVENPPSRFTFAQLLHSAREKAKARLFKLIKDRKLDGAAPPSPRRAPLQLISSTSYSGGEPVEGEPTEPPSPLPQFSGGHPMADQAAWVTQSLRLKPKEASES